MAPRCRDPRGLAPCPWDAWDPVGAGELREPARARGGSPLGPSCPGVAGPYRACARAGRVRRAPSFARARSATPSGVAVPSRWAGMSSLAGGLALPPRSRGAPRSPFRAGVRRSAVRHLKSALMRRGTNAKRSVALMKDGARRTG